MRNDADGYGVVTKTLHWVTVAALGAQLVVGYLLDDEGGGQGRGRAAGRDRAVGAVAGATTGRTTTGSGPCSTASPTGCSPRTSRSA